MRYLLFLILVNIYPFAFAVEWEESRLFSGLKGTETLKVISSTDTSVFAPIVERFLFEHPEYNVEYLVAGSADIYDRFRHAPNQYDVVISSAMDLQLKLVNDGLAYRLADIAHPDWAQWRMSLFGFTLESASIVINKEAFANLSVPRSRQEMIEVLRANPDTFSRRVGTYDVRQSGLGYLFATQDSRASETYWRLMEIMGSLETRLYCCSGEMIEDLAQGEIDIAYNVLGSYAMARKDLADKIEVILPADFHNAMMRTAFVAKGSKQLRSAELFLRYLAAATWSDPEVADSTLPSLKGLSDSTLKATIALEPGLLIFLDRLKRQNFLRAWENTIIQ